MKDQTKDLWISLEDKIMDPELVEQSAQEFPSDTAFSDEKLMEHGTSRRDFLKYLGFGLGAATMAAACEIPVRKAIPYVVKPDEIVPGVATYYATSFVDGGDFCSVLVKTREGRPIKIEGNALSGISKGGTSARAQASVLSLYDTARFRDPGKVENRRIEAMSWEDLDNEIKEKLASASSVRVVSRTNISPTAQKAVNEVAGAFSDVQHVMYDPVSYSAMLDANEQNFGQRVIPSYHFDAADIIVSFNADFLGTWLSPVEFASQYSDRRKISDPKNPNMSRHIQVESHMSLTGSNADNRILVKPSEQGVAIATLYNAVAAKTGGSAVSTPAINEKAKSALNKLAGDLVNANGKSLIVSASNNPAEQSLVNAINNMLGNYGSTLDMSSPSLQRKGDDKAMQDLVAELESGRIGAIIFWDANPVYDLPNGEAFGAALEKAGVSISLNGSMDETTAKCQYVAPSHHYLESWGDAEPKAGHYSLIQPTIAPLFKTRQAEESMLVWANSENLSTESEQPYYDYLKNHWQEAIYPQQQKFVSFKAFWDTALHDGVVEITGDSGATAFSDNIASIASRINKPSGSEIEISFFESVNMGAGQNVNNPWLMEMPDPLTRTVWGNYLHIPISWDGYDDYISFNDLKDGDQVDVTINGVTQQCTVVRQFGQMEGTVSIYLGYGREIAGPCGRGVGVNVNPWLSVSADGQTQYFAGNVEISGKIGKEKNFASVQHHHTLGVTGVDESTGETINVDEKALMTLGDGYQGALTDRSIIYRGHVNELETFVDELKETRHEFADLNDNTLYPDFESQVYENGHHWGMHIDLNACTGCGACTVACMAENNVPVVGQFEVKRHHEMTWLRIDRYFYGDVENPNVVYQPMMCQHCDNAPCENVCPVAATNHSSEGLNQMAYNRCIGTRYCANNCPYKVRRFNWLDYTTADIFPRNEYHLNDEELPFGADNLTRMVLNPDVTVRSRGVMEKCSFCVQRIQEGKLTAKREGRSLRDSDVRTACQTSCPTGAITFGDMNNPTGDLGQMLEYPLNYQVLEETNTRPSVTYSARINNRDESLEA